MLDVADTIGRHMNRPKTVVTKSTVPVGTAARVRQAVAAHAKQPFYVASNPEFLKEGAAVQDFMKPDRIVIGVDGPEARAMLAELYEPFVRSGNPILFMDVASAEMTKYAANAMLAARITLMNQFANLCDAVGADIDHVRLGIGSDARIGKQFLFPGPGYGGSCFPKDVRALVATAQGAKVPLGVLASVHEANEAQKQVPVAKLRRLLGDTPLKGRRVAIWGLAFKAQTDDMRESAALAAIETLTREGASVVVHDPKAMDEARRRLGDRVAYAEHHYDALKGADALLVLTEWQEYRVIDVARLKSLMKQAVVVDARNLYDPARLRQQGVRYASIGRP